MQVLPSTGRALARKDGVSPFQTAQLYQPGTNVRLGTLYFADLLSRYDGRISYVLAAYNAGPSRVARWREMPEAGDPDLFAERIPFRETRDYVKVVQQNARIYRAVYGE
jgi:soluble lytic murein transglycosylase